MQDVLRDAMHAGAAGFATSFAFPHRGIDGKPVPSRFADRAELEALLDTMGEVGLGVVSIAPGDPCPPADMFDLQLKVGVPFTWGALLTSPGRDHQQALDANRAGWERGAEVWPQVTPRPLTFTFTLDSPYPLAVNEHFAALQNASVDERARAYADPAWREQMMQGCERRRELRSALGHLHDRAERGAPGAGRPPAGRRRRRAGRRAARRACSTSRSTSPASSCACAPSSPTTTRPAWPISWSTSTARSGSPTPARTPGQLCDAPQATDLLGNWVRDKGVVPMEQAIRKLSGQQADIFGFADRGYLRPGALGRRRGVRSRHRRARSDPAGARLPGRTRSASPPTSPSACSTSS